MRHTDCDTILPVLVSRISLRNWKLITLGIAQIARAPPLVLQWRTDKQLLWTPMSNWVKLKTIFFLGQKHHLPPLFRGEGFFVCMLHSALRVRDDKSSQLIESCTQTFAETAAGWSSRMRRINPPEHPGSCSCQGSLITSSKLTRVTTKGLLETLKTLGLGHAAPGVGKTTNCDI